VEDWTAKDKATLIFKLPIKTNGTTCSVKMTVRSNDKLATVHGLTAVHWTVTFKILWHTTALIL